MKILSKLSVIVVLVLLTATCSKINEKAADIKSNETPAAFWNLTGNVVAHDPCIIKEGSTWWSFQTGTGVGVKYSSNGLNWTQGVQRFASELSWWRTYAPNMGSNDVWAPDCFYYNGRYWLYYSVSEFGKNNSAIGLTSCSSIAKGDWRDDGMVVSTKSGSSAANAIDPNVTQDASGNLWLSYGSWFDGIKLVKLSTSTMKPTGSTYSLAKRSNGIEGSDIVYNGGYYYLFVSIDKCCLGVNSTYKIAYGRSTSITGPYTAQDGTAMLSGGCTVFDSGNSRWIGPGGQDIYKNGSSYVIIRHAYDATDNGTPKMLINDLYFSGG
ncbi:MAG TPA: glycoside hydrolase family 43 protein, partial [Bacteroidales bacterium]